MATIARERAEAMREAANPDSKVTLTDLGRSNAWRRKLADNGVLQLMDRSDTAGFIVSVEAMNDLLDSLDAYEDELETLSVRDMFLARSGRTELKSGADLTETALASFDRRADALMDVASKGEAK